MSTRSGKKYKLDDRPEMRETIKSMEQMMQTLIEDRRKREEEFAAERAAREKDTEKRIQDMQTQMEALMKLVSESHKAKTPLGNGPQVKLVPLTEQDDIESYLVTFERIMDAYKIAKEQWTYYLAPQLTGRAQQAFAALPKDESSTYDGVKAAILLRYGVNEDAYRRRFRAVSRKDGETNRELAIRLLDLQNKWLRKCGTMEAVKEAVALEQFLNTLSMEKRAWVRDKKPDTCIAAGELADEYELARNVEFQEKPQDLQVKKQSPSALKKWCTYCKTAGHTRDQCRKLQGKREKESQPGDSSREASTREQGKRPPIKCFNCRQEGHIAANCPGEPALLCDTNPVTASKDLGIETWRRSGKVEGKFVPEIVLDTGCKRTMVHQELVPPEKIIEGDVATIRCAHGDTVLYPLAKVNMEIEGVPIEVEAAVSSTLPVSVLLGEDVPALNQLLGNKAVRTCSTADDVLVVVTRAQAKKQLEEEIIRREQEVLSGARASPVQGLGQASDDTGHPDTKSGGEIPLALTQEQRRSLNQQMGKQDSSENWKPRVDALELSADQLKKLQEKDDTLSKIREAADGHPNSAGIGFFKQDGLVYRKWTPPRRGEGYEIEQLVLPKECRRAVLELGHEIPLAGHLGVEKTRQRILRRFYWPSVFKDIDEFCRCCEVCQKSSKRNVPPAPLIPLPIISEPFKKIAMDIVGPLPRSRSGNRYVLVICDYATRYPEAIPLRSIDALHVAEELIKVFSRVGVPQEILTDQGSNFTSQLLAELYRLLHIHPIRTSPYHPQTDGLVERFNQTLKSMLRKAVTDEGKDWDKLVPYLLFAYREVPQASTGFSPFELLYGRNVRGPLDVLKESWEATQKSDESVVSYVLSTQEKLRKMTELVHENLTKAQGKQKAWYDKNAHV